MAHPADARNKSREIVADKDKRIAELEAIGRELFDAIYDEGVQSVELGQRAAKILKINSR